MPPPDARAIELAAAAAWPAATAVERDGWLLRATPGVPHRRNNSALPLLPDPPIEEVERFYATRPAAGAPPKTPVRFGAEPLVAVAPLEHLTALDAELERRGWTAEGATDVLVAPAESVARERGQVEPVDPMAWPNQPIRDEVLARSRGDLFAFAEGQSGAVLCIRTGDLAGIFRLHVAQDARRAGVATRLVAACAEVAPTLYAQVEAENAQAQALFARAGFTRSHGYHYRRGPAR